MRKRTVPCGALLAAAFAAQAQGSVQIFGRVDNGIEISKSGLGLQKRQISSGYGGSRLGFDGAEDLGGGASAVFRLAMGINTDDGTLAQGGRGFGRESWVGLSSKDYGTVYVGRAETPTYRTHTVIDAFNYGSAGMGQLSRSTPGGVYQVVPLANNARLDNAISYLSPLMSGFSVHAMMALDEDSPTVGRAYDIALRYRTGSWDLNAAFGLQKGSAHVAESGKASSFLIGGIYDFGTVKLVAGYTEERNSCATCTGALARVPGVTGSNASRFQLAHVGTRVVIGPAVLIAQYIRLRDRSDYAVETGSRSVDWLAVGMEYYLSKRTMVYAAATTLKNKNGSLYALGTGSSQQPVGSVGRGNPQATTVALGISHAF
ncbi:porin [Variovorax paradoxus]|uniref:porin n=1 Tax=Variovorax paradoxus TaxID=34073 RepID=UPI0019312CC9|nr:porin [Variovorax paradoxus]